MKYRLPDGRLVEVHDDVARGAQRISFTLEGGRIVYATRADTYPPPGCTMTPRCSACVRAGYVFRCSRCKRRVAWCVGGSDDSRCATCWCIVQRALRGGFGARRPRKRSKENP